MEITPKACGDKTGRKKTLNHTAGKGEGYKQDLLRMNLITRLALFTEKNPLTPFF